MQPSPRRNERDGEHRAMPGDDDACWQHRQAIVEFAEQVGLVSCEKIVAVARAETDLQDTIRRWIDERA